MRSWSLRRLVGTKPRLSPASAQCIDNEFFKVIDTEPLDVGNNDHLRLLAYRSVMRELHTTIEEANRLALLDEELVKAAGGDPQETVSLSFLLAVDFYKKALDVYRYRNKHFDRPMQQGKKAEMKHSVLELPNQASVLAVSAFFSTSHNEQGGLIGPTLNVIPLGVKLTAVILSCPIVLEYSVKKALDSGTPGR